MALAHLDTFKDLPDSIVRSDSAWRAWYDQEAPEAVPIPDFETRLTKFQRMCLVRYALDELLSELLSRSETLP